VSANVVNRFWSKVDKTGDCWEWHAKVASNGYGHFWLEGRNRLAHRVAYEMVVGPIAEGLQLDHLCRNPRCVRPDHLEPVTARVNTLRSTNGASQNFRKTHCPAGHPYDEQNTYLQRRNGRVERVCRACGRAKQRRYYERKILRSAGVAA